MISSSIETQMSKKNWRAENFKPIKIVVINQI